MLKPLLWIGIVLMSIQIRIRLSISPIFFYFYSQQCQFTMLYLSHQCQRCHNFIQFGQHIEIFWKKYSLSLTLAKINTYTGSDKIFKIRQDPESTLLVEMTYL
jgi:hypothetical protein